MNEGHASQEKEILILLRGILRIQRHADEQVGGMFFLITGKTSYYHHAISLSLHENTETSPFPSLEKTELFSFLDKVLEGASQSDLDNPFLRNLRTNLDYVLTRFFTPRDIDHASNDLEGGRRNTALNLANYLENNYGVETSVDVLFERREKKELRKYLGGYSPPASPENEGSQETASSEPEGDPLPPSGEKTPQKPLRPCSLLIDPLHGVAVNSLAKGWRLAVAFPENAPLPSSAKEALPGSLGNPFPGTVTALYPLEDGGYIIQLLLDGDPPSACEASLDGNYRIRIWQDPPSSPSRKNKASQKGVPQSEKALFYIALTIGVAAVLSLGYYFFLTP
ncbi:MAG TPA: hypothetical protein PK364_04310 [Synergistaceae bacterium]|nr:hypothetical protein [Synergistaceae bacterium]HPJ24546.1 hypothetical protein [Synergistaceae bacterium]HPQ36303.1 hypothetical protein [Synergistaceae bacterium]